MEMIVDFMLLAASGVATFYCFILSRKLEDLKSTEKGLGASIATMSTTVEQARGAVALARESSTESINALKPLIAETRDVLPKLSELVDIISELSEIAVNDIDDAASKAMHDLKIQTGNAQELLAGLKAQTEALNGLMSVDDSALRSGGAADNNEDNVAYLDNVEPSRDSASSRVTAALEQARKVRSKTNRTG